MKLNIDDLAWEKMSGLLPAIVQDGDSGIILMLGYMNKEALLYTLQTEYITFYSRAKKRLWTKGETSGHKLQLISITSDCDNDCLLIQAKPHGPVCHQGTYSCFGNDEQFLLSFLTSLEKVIAQREKERPPNSYSTQLFNQGLSRIAQKIGEEGVEVALASIEKSNEELGNEVADLLFHVFVLLRARKLALSDVIRILKGRHINQS